LVFGGKILSATNEVRNASSAGDLPHGTGSAYYAIASTERGWGKGLEQGKGALASSPSSHLSTLSSDAGEAKEAGEAKAMAGKPNRSPTLLFITATGGFSAAMPNLPH
jgi:hypothetical protein